MPPRKNKSLRSARHRALVGVLIATRKEAKLTQREAAAKAKVPQSFIAKIEAGERRMDVVEFIEYATALRVDPQQLFARILRW